MDTPYNALRDVLLRERGQLVSRVEIIDQVLDGFDRLNGTAPPTLPPKALARPRGKTSAPAGSSGDPRQDQARELFVTQGEAAVTIAKQLKVAVGTIYAWSSKGKWGKAKKKAQRGKDRAADDSEED